MNTGLGRTDVYCYSVITGVRGCIPLFKREKMVVEGGLEQNFVRLDYADFLFKTAWP